MSRIVLWIGIVITSVAGTAFCVYVAIPLKYEPLVFGVFLTKIVGSGLVASLKLAKKIR